MAHRCTFLLRNQFISQHNFATRGERRAAVSRKRPFLKQPVVQTFKLWITGGSLRITDLLLEKTMLRKLLVPMCVLMFFGSVALSQNTTIDIKDSKKAEECDAVLSANPDGLQTLRQQVNDCVVACKTVLNHLATETPFWPICRFHEDRNSSRPGWARI